MTGNLRLVLNERAAREFAALLHSRRAWQLERNAEEKGADSPE